MTATWLHDVVGRDEHGRDLRLDGGLEQRPLAARRLGDDEAVDAAAADPLEHDARVVVAAQLEAREHQAGVARRELFLDAGQQLREPGVLGGVDGHADAALAAETEVARGPGPGIAERLDDVGQAGADGTAHVVAVQVPRHGADGDTRLRRDGRDSRLLFAGWHVAQATGPGTRDGHAPEALVGRIRYHPRPTRVRPSPLDRPRAPGRCQLPGARAEVISQQRNRRDYAGSST